jgi:putative SOS response-associated peptidase YedK
MRENVVILLTTEAIDGISHIHSRMPLLSNEPVFRNWNLNQVNIEINTYEVSREVSYVGNNSPELIKPIS